MYIKIHVRKWEFLGGGMRKELPGCVYKLVHKFPPVPAGDEAMAFKEV